jgi:hypothetical protein
VVSTHQILTSLPPGYPLAPLDKQGVRIQGLRMADSAPENERKLTACGEQLGPAWLYGSGLLSASAVSPSVDFAAQPEPRPPATAVQYRTRHVGIPSLVQMNRRRMRQAEQQRYVMSVHEVIDVHQTAHALTLWDNIPVVTGDSSLTRSATLSLNVDRLALWRSHEHLLRRPGPGGRCPDACHL